MLSSLFFGAIVLQEALYVSQSLALSAQALHIQSFENTCNFFSIMNEIFIFLQSKLKKIKIHNWNKWLECRVRLAWANKKMYVYAEAPKICPWGFKFFTVLQTTRSIELCIQIRDGPWPDLSLLLIRSK